MAPKVLIVGLGALGTVVAQRLHAAGIELVLQDYDIVQEQNLSTPFFARDDIGKLKVAAVRQRLGGECREEAFGPDSELVGISAIVDCTDSLAAKLLVNDAAKRASIPLVVGAAARGEGMATAACWQCITHGKTAVDDCSMGIDPDVAEAVATAQANLTLRALQGEREEALLLIGKNGERKITVRKNARCEACRGRYVHLSAPFSLAFCAGSRKLQARPSRPVALDLSAVEGEVISRYPTAVQVRLGHGSALVHRHGLVEFDSVPAAKAQVFIRNLRY